MCLPFTAEMRFSASCNVVQGVYMAIKEEERQEFAETKVADTENVSSTDVNVRTGMTNDQFDLHQKKEVDQQIEFKDELYSAVQRGDIQRVKELTGWTRDATRPDNTVVTEVTQETQENAHLKEKEEETKRQKELNERNAAATGAEPVDPLMAFLTDPFGLHNPGAAEKAENYSGNSLEEAIRRGDWTAAARIMNALRAREQNEKQDFNDDGHVSGGSSSSMEAAYGPGTSDSYGGTTYYDSSGNWYYGDRFGGVYDTYGYTYADGSKTGADGSHVDAQDPSVIVMADGTKIQAQDAGLDGSLEQTKQLQDLLVLGSQTLNGVEGNNPADPTFQQTANSAEGAANTPSTPQLSAAGQGVVIRATKKHGVTGAKVEVNNVFTAVRDMQVVDETTGQLRLANKNEQEKMLQALNSEDESIRNAAFAKINIDPASGNFTLKKASQDSVASFSTMSFARPGSTSAPEGESVTPSAVDTSTWYEDEYGYYDLGTGSYYEKDASAEAEGWQGDYYSDDGWSKDADGNWTSPEGTIYYADGDISYADGGYEWADGAYMDAEGTYVDANGDLYLSDNFESTPNALAADAPEGGWKEAVKAAAASGTTFTMPTKDPAVAPQSVATADVAPSTVTAPTTSTAPVTSAFTAGALTAGTAAGTLAAGTTASALTGAGTNTTGTTAISTETGAGSLYADASVESTLNNFSQFIGSLTSFLSTSDVTRALNEFAPSSFIDLNAPITTGSSSIWGTKFFDPAAIGVNPPEPEDPLKSIAPTNPYYKPAAGAGMSV